MNVYFTVSFRGAEANAAILSKVVDRINEMGHKVTKRNFRKSNDDRDSKVAKVIDLREFSVEDAYKITSRKIREADVIIADTSVASSGVGYEIAMAISEKKPILALHSKKSTTQAADVLAGNNSKLLKLKTYDSADEAVKYVESFLKEARDFVDTKFILIISPQIDRYLEWASEERRMHKAQIVREAVENMMTKDKDYKEFVKSIG